MATVVIIFFFPITGVALMFSNDRGERERGNNTKSKEH
jgi:hypothetical protein